MGVPAFEFMISTSAARTPSELEDFIRFPWKIYHDCPNWVPPTISAQKKELDRERGAFFNDGFGSDAEFFLCRDGGEIVGRIASIRNERHLARQNDGVGFFGFFECVDRLEVAQSLFEAAESWLIENKLTIARGPTSYSINDPAGVMVKGHEFLPPLLTGYTPEYYGPIVESLGYRKVRDLLGFELSMEALEENLFKFEDLFSQASREDIEVRQIRRSEMISEAELIARLFSESWDRNWGAYPLLPEELVNAAREMGPIFDERLGYIAYVGGEPAGVFLAIPDPSDILRELNGRFGVKGALKMLRFKKRFRRIRLILLGTLPRFSTLPIAPMMVREIQRRRSEFPTLESVELFWILEENRPTRELATAVGGEHTRTLRIFEKFL